MYVYIPKQCWSFESEDTMAEDTMYRSSVLSLKSEDSTAEDSVYICISLYAGWSSCLLYRGGGWGSSTL